MVRNIKIEPAVKLESKRIAIGVLAMSVIMEIVFVVLGRFDYTVLLGNLLGGGWAILNFFLMALAVQKSVKKELPQEAKLVLQNSYTKRLLFSVAILLIGIKVEYFNWISVVIPLIFPRITIAIIKLPIFQRKEEE
ncbi:ATP synthase subunit I [Butyricicoccus sp.]|uniref:ATP synthase subunit I n=1 Tax=Butyricicoccus sp. TaxID=2049021 RepID=UPI002A8E3C8D|nr:ATP synthase subunit I [Butyricicoccus sp.]